MNPSVNDTTSIEARCSSQKNALRLIYNALGGDNWCRKEKWFSSEDVSEWSGVTCNPRGQITALELSQNNLQGRLDNIIEALDCLALTLEQLWLSENGLIGNLPPVLADRSRFPVLSILDVGSNQLSGSLHPAFTRAKHFSWFDVTGTNQLTSYFRHENKNSSSNTFAFTSRINSSSSSSPLVNVHVVECLLPILDCQTIIDLAVDYTQRNGGWQMDRHKDYQTTDIDVALVGGELLRLCNDLLKECILPALSQFFGFAMEDLAIVSLFMFGDLGFHCKVTDVLAFVMSTANFRTRRIYLWQSILLLPRTNKAVYRSIAMAVNCPLSLHSMRVFKGVERNLCKRILP